MVLCVASDTGDQALQLSVDVDDLVCCHHFPTNLIDYCYNSGNERFTKMK